MRQATRQTRRRMQGFSIVELMVSVGIIVLLIAISYPFLSALNRGSRIEAGLNIVGMSSDVARQWVEAESWANDGSTAAPTLESYSGTAAIYCPTGEIRIVVNDRNADQGGNNYLEDFALETNGYKDLDDVAYIRIPDGVGIAGIQRFGAGNNDVQFIAPPFAIAYNELGQLNYGDANGYIYYDGDGDGNYETARTRQSGYNPSGADENSASLRPDGVSLELPFEAIECVPGVVIFNLNDFEDAGFTFDGGGVLALGGTEGQWLNANGETIFFSPHTGVALRDEE